MCYFARNQLQVITADELEPPKDIELNKYEVETILKKQKKKGKIEYLIK
jgi:hypothetical protein